MSCCSLLFPLAYDDWVVDMQAYAALIQTCAPLMEYLGTVRVLRVLFGKFVYRSDD